MPAATAPTIATTAITRYLAAAAWLFVFAASTITLADPDLWGHVRFGLDILQTHAIPSVDPYSFTQDRPWINHEWLSEVQMALAYAAAGAAGLALLKGCVVTAMLFVLWRGWRGVDLGPRVVLLAFVAAGTARAALTLRPQDWSLLLTAVLLRAFLSERPRVQWWLAGVFALWANLHGGWIVGLAIAGMWWGMSVVSRAARAKRAATGLIVCVAATLLTPYGPTLWTFLLETVRLGRNVQEWQPLWTAPPANGVVFAAAAAIAAWSFFKLPNRRLPTLGVWMMLAVAAVRVERLLPFFVIAVAALAAPAFRRSWPVRVLPPPESSGERRILIGFGAAACAAAVGIGATSLRCVPVRGAWVPDAEVADVLRAAPPGRLVTFFDWGEYAIWHFGPALKVSMDGRRETVYSPRQLAIHDAIIHGEPEGFRALEAWRPDVVWLPEQAFRTREWLLAHGYLLTLQTTASFVASRMTPPSARDGSNGRSGARCFPQ